MARALQRWPPLKRVGIPTDHRRDSKLESGAQPLHERQCVPSREYHGVRLQSRQRAADASNPEPEERVEFRVAPGLAQYAPFVSCQDGNVPLEPASESRRLQSG